MNGERQLKMIKTALVRLKNQIKDSSLNEGVIQNTLFSCSQMRAGKHHLYDDVMINGGTAGGGTPTKKSTTY
jgi:hypothetical protein